MKEITNSNKCTGCGACNNICPVKCISMVSSSEGFQYPQIEKARCINCEQCKRVCPINCKSNQVKYQPNYYLVQSQDSIEKKNSTSGGFFSCMANYIIKEKGIVFGVGYEKMKVCHCKIERISDVLSLCGSKYVQSDVGNSYSEIGKYLKKHRYVLFVGTPCQVAGLFSYLSQKAIDDTYLFTIQLKCYGVPSPGVFEKYVNSIEKKYKEKLISINFRDKEYGYSTSTISAHFQNGSIISNQYAIKSFSKTFFAGLNIRESCFDCQFRDNDTCKADFIVGDFREVGNYIPDIDDEKGTTLLTVMTDKGESVLGKLDGMEKYYLKNYQETPNRNPVKNNLRDDFFEDVSVFTWEQVTDKYVPNSVWDYLASNIKPIIHRLPMSVLLFKLIKNINNKKYIKRTRLANGKNVGSSPK